MSKFYRYPESHVFYRKLTRAFPKVVRGEGCWLYDEAGKKYLDACGGAFVANLGHGISEIADAIGEQAYKIAYVNGTAFTNEPAEALASEIARLSPGDLKKVYFLSSGSEAVEAALKLARQFWVESGNPSKHKIIATTPGYHGNTLLALSASARKHYKTLFKDWLVPVTMIPAPYPYRCACGAESRGTSRPLAPSSATTGGKGCTTSPPIPAAHMAAGIGAEGRENKKKPCAGCSGEALEEAIRKEGADTVAAFITEPIGGSSTGASVPHPGYYKRIRQICDRHKVLLIADEVLTGAGRTGAWSAMEHFGVAPDMMTLGKGLSGGYVPLSAVVASERLVATIAKGSGSLSHAQTFSHTPVICAAGLAAVQYIQKHDLINRAQKMGEILHKRLQKLRELPGVGDVRGKGMLAGVEFVKDKPTRAPFPRRLKMAETLVDRAQENGLVLWPNVGHADGENGDLVMIAPPFIITEKEIDEIVSRLTKSLEQTMHYLEVKS